jgi:hypothetical protein
MFIYLAGLITGIAAGLLFSIVIINRQKLFVISRLDRVNKIVNSMVKNPGAGNEIH